MKAPSFIFVAIVFAAMIYFFNGPFRKQLIEMSSPSPGCIEMLGHTTTPEDDRASIVGSIRNNCKRKYGFVQVNFKVTSAIDNLPAFLIYAHRRDLQPGETWRFKTQPFSNYSGYRFDSITAY